MSELSHFDDQGASRMVDVSSKQPTLRVARASGRVRMAAATLELVRQGGLAKGDVLSVARLAGIMAAKRTSDLVPLCHPLPLESVEVSFDFPDNATVAIEAIARVTARTGVEMEALVAVSVAALTIYDMCKSVDRSMTIDAVRLEEKQGGRSGHYARKDEGAGSAERGTGSAERTG
ncbi:MAG TPA: cyclic pyranopterin monophosphate synthase MoaC [Pirellulales bacterium]|jgi:cyclic pyranopterin phosphate synthase|nr:cyclic pyranopterin monophosphate synthase MoaC [Pirellulales bacterium]